jgi:hypothetical protein
MRKRVIGIRGVKKERGWRGKLEREIIKMEKLNLNKLGLMGFQYWLSLYPSSLLKLLGFFSISSA